MKAENKLLFVAFCIEYCNYYHSLNNNLDCFYSDYPIQVDATCNGYQHLALLLGDNSLAEHLNLKERTLQDKPKDFYSFIAMNLKELFREQLIEIESNKDSITRNKLLPYKDSYARLYKLDIQRSLIKKPIMTKPYNVTIKSMQEYILEDFVLDSDSEKRSFLKKEEGRGII
jgi:DNA-directed RNA polymerase